MTKDDDARGAMMLEHSPEPFSVIGCDLTSIGSAEVPSRIKRSDDFEEPWLVAVCRSPEDARRIVACVNACQGVPTKKLETRSITVPDDKVTTDDA